MEGRPTNELCSSNAIEAGAQSVQEFVHPLDAAVIPVRLRLSTPVAGQTGEVKLASVGADGSPVGRYVLRLDRGMAVESRPLLLPPGRWLAVVAAPGTPFSYQLEIVKVAVEPASASATRLNSFAELLASTPVGIEWTVSEEAAEGLWNLSFQPPLGTEPNLTLLTTTGATIASASVADSHGRVDLADLQLAAGKYRLTFATSAKSPPSLVSATAVSPHAAGFAVEPDRTQETARPITVGSTTAGRLVPGAALDDTDVFRFTVQPGDADRRLEPSVRARGGNAHLTLSLRDGAGRTLTTRSGDSEVRLPALALQSGTYWLALSGALPPEATYELRVDARAAAAQGQEVEPNDTPPDATRVPVTRPILGTFDGSERDHVALEVASGLELWNVEASGDGVTRLALLDRSGSVVAAAARDAAAPVLRLSNLLLPPGTHVFRLEGERGRWLVRAAKVGEPRDDREAEPNDDVGRAQPLVGSVVHSGALDRTGDVDVWTFRQRAHSRIAVEIEAPFGSDTQARLVWGENGTPIATVKAATGDGPEKLEWQGVVGPGEYSLSLSAGRVSRDPYRVRVAAGPPWSSSAIPDATVALEVASAKVAAWSSVAQTVAATLTLENRASAPLELAATGWTSDERWRMDGLPAQLTVPAGQSLRVPLQLHLGPDVCDDCASEAAVRLATVEGRAGLARATLAALVEAPPIAPSAWEGSDDAAARGIDVASAAQGAKTAPAAGALIDPWSDAAVRVDPGTPIEIDLAGDVPVQVRALILQPPAGSPPGERASVIRVEGSADGRWEPLLDARLSPTPRPQVFALERAASVTGLRVTALERHDGSAGPAMLARFAAFAKPADALTSTDLLAPELGGHAVAASPQPSMPVTGQSTYWPGAYRVSYPAQRREPAALTVGFDRGRSARIERVRWKVRSDTPAESIPRRIRVETSVESPLGPWQVAGALAGLTVAAREADVVVNREVRYLRFVIEEPKQGSVDFPERIEAFGQSLDESGTAPGDAGRSVGAASDGVPGGSDRESAAKLVAGAIAGGRVARGESRWYALSLPPGTRSLRLRGVGGGRPTVGVVVIADDGTEHPLFVDPRQPTTLVGAIPAGAHWLRVTAQPHAVVVTWDTSSSVAPFSAAIARAVRSVSRSLTDDSVRIALMPFRGGATSALSPGFTSDRAALVGALHGYAWTDSSSEADAALLNATTALAGEPGAPTVVMITDGASPPDQQTAALWQAIEQVRPRIVVARVPSGDSGITAARQVNLLEDWARAGGGRVETMGTAGDFETLFRREAARWGRESQYALKLEAQSSALPPGKVRVAAGRELLSSPPMVVVLLDVSGSMLQRMGPERRIDAAKRSLGALLKATASDDVAVGLRVLGSGKPGSCETSVLFPAVVGSRSSAQAALAKLQAVNGAKTPIAAALSAAAGDLRNAKDRATVVLITDGEETCGGDVDAAIAELRALGVDVRMNVVGFAVGDSFLKGEFARWAQSGGGQYFDARDASALERALLENLLVPVRIRSTQGDTFPARLNGRPIAVPPGRYSAEIDSIEHAPVEPRWVGSDDEAVITIDGTPGQASR